MTITPPAPCDYRVRVDLDGVYSFVVDKGAVPDYVTNPIELADPLAIGWALPENGLAYPQPDPMWAVVNIVVQDMATLEALDVGTPVRIRVWSDLVEANLIAHFRGKVGDLSAEPYKVNLNGVATDLGMRVTATCVHFAVDLSETPVGAGAWPQETVQQRTDRIAAEAGIAVAPTWPTGVDSEMRGYPINARAAGLTDARTQLVRLVDTVAEYLLIGGAGGGIMRREFLVPNYPGGDADATPDALEPWTLAEVRNRYYTGGQGVAYVAPGVLADLGTGLWGIAISEHASSAGDSGVIDADYVDFRAKWALGKRDRADEVTVTGPFTLAFGVAAASDSVTVSGPDPVPVKLALETDHADSAYARYLGDFNLTSHDSDRWAADEFLFYADLDPDRFHIGGDGMLVFSDHDYPLVTDRPWIVDGIPAAQNPSLVDYLAGQLAAASLTISKGRLTSKLRIRRNLPRQQIETGGDGTDYGYLAPAQLKVATGPSLPANTGFEVNATGYTGVNATLARVTTQHHTGVGALSVTATGANPTAVDSGSGVGGFPVTALRLYQVPAWAKSAVTARSVQPRVDWWNAAGGFISQSVGVSVADSAAGWTDLTQTFLAPAGAAFARRQFIVVGAAVAEVHYLDDLDMKLIPFGHITPAMLDPRFSAYDYRIARNANA